MKPEHEKQRRSAEIDSSTLLQKNLFLAAIGCASIKCLQKAGNQNELGYHANSFGPLKRELRPFNGLTAKVRFHCDTI